MKRKAITVRVSDEVDDYLTTVAKSLGTTKSALLVIGALRLARDLSPTTNPPRLPAAPSEEGEDPCA